MTLLVGWLWQGLAIALGAALVLRACRRLDAATRHVTWWAVLAAVLALPFAQRAATPEAAAAVPAALEMARESGAAVLLPATPDWVIAVALGAWLGYVLLGVARLARSLRFIVRLKRESWPLPEVRQRALHHWMAARARGRRVRLLVSDHVRTASAVGLGRSAVVLPATLVDALDDQTLDRVVMHEHAHLQRRDDVWRLVQALVECVVGIHPAVRIAVHGIELEREAACDDHVLALCGSPRAYASCLAETAALASTRRVDFEPSMIPGAVRRSSTLRRRVTRLLDADRRHQVRVAPGRAIVGIVVLFACVGIAAQVEPLVTFDTGVTRESPASSIASATTLDPPVRDAVGPSPRAVPQGGTRQADWPRSTVSRPRAVSEGTSVGPATLPASAALPPPSAPDDSEPPTALASRTPGVSHDAAPTVVASGSAPLVTGDRVSPWAAAADGGTAIGSAARRGGLVTGATAKKTGTAVGGFFTRAARGIANSF